ncbi:apolipoprotein N-acyltransferase [Dissulfurirhabdus thermomarina]|uniref:Apolipoprotein N-acyltransferase n=1 Tax=Dissulfurirhabdus thermomarina TaxID=1765737 RepID=A0A6N9TTR2_DISTH|nr:apolipoprotein N-acyltransferase [Dissulfurirhabdus thermomarina]NDY42817.1 apolipoprotein N-acyltransferase [Dissulfurirhabdus thermomarina]
MDAAARPALAAAGGLALTAAFPPVAAWPLVLAGPAMLLAAADGRPPAAAFRLGYVFGLVHFTSLLWWIAPTVARYGGLPSWGALPVPLLLAAYLALYPGAWTAGLALWRRGRSHGRLVPLVAAAAWTLLEWLRGHLLSGFPWGALAYALAPRPELIQTAEIWGPYGLSFWTALGAGLLWLGCRRVPGRRRARAAALAAFAALALAGWGWGAARIRAVRADDARRPVLRAAVVQGAVPQDRKWDPAFQAATVEIYRRLSLAAAAGWHPDRPALVVWPETATPFYFQDPGPLSRAVREIPVLARAALLFGSPAHRPGPGGGVAYLNSAYLLDRLGRVRGRYDKRHLVPFGEYLPWGPLTAWARGLIPSVGEFTPGAAAAPLAAGDIRVGPLICFESIFPALARRSAAAGANVLAVLTNDAWFGRTGAPFQHAAMAALRAVETRRWVIRAANTGVSAFFTPWGACRRPTRLFRRTWIAEDVRLRDGRTPYLRAGDFPVLAGVIFLPAAAIFLEYFLATRRPGTRRPGGQAP